MNSAEAANGWPQMCCNDIKP